MKQLTLAATIVTIALATMMSSCKTKDNAKPVEQELITTLKLDVTDGGSFSKTFTYKVENGFGGTTPGTVQIDTVKLGAGITYNVTATLYNEKTSPVTDVTTEVLSEQDVHLFLYQSTPASGAGSITCSDGSKDNNGLPFNQTINFTTGAAGSGNLQVNLMHEPTDKTGTTPATAGGETDVEVTFPVIIE